MWPPGATCIYLRRIYCVPCRDGVSTPAANSRLLHGTRSGERWGFPGLRRLDPHPAPNLELRGRQTASGTSALQKELVGWAQGARGGGGAGFFGRGVKGRGRMEGARPRASGGARSKGRGTGPGRVRGGARQKGRAQLRAGPGSWLPAGRAGAWRPSREPLPGRRTRRLGAEPRQVRHGSGARTGGARSSLPGWPESPGPGSST